MKHHRAHHLASNPLFSMITGLTSGMCVHHIHRYRGNNKETRYYFSPWLISAPPRQDSINFHITFTSAKTHRTIICLGWQPQKDSAQRRRAIGDHNQHGEAHRCFHPVKSGVTPECAHMPSILKADNPRAHCPRTMTSRIPQESPAPPQGRCRADGGMCSGSCPGARRGGREKHNYKIRSKTEDLWLKSDGSCGPSAKRRKREAGGEQRGEHAGAVGRSAQHKSRTHKEPCLHLHGVVSHYLSLL